MQIAMHTAGAVEPTAQPPQRSRQLAAKRRRSQARVFPIANKFVQRHRVGDRIGRHVTVADKKAPRLSANGHACNGLDSGCGDFLGRSGFALGLSASDRISNPIPPAVRLEVLEEDGSCWQLEAEDRAMWSRLNGRDSLGHLTLRFKPLGASICAERLKAVCVKLANDLFIPTPRDTTDLQRVGTRRRGGAGKPGLRMVSGGCAIHATVFRRPVNPSLPVASTQSRRESSSGFSALSIFRIRSWRRSLAGGAIKSLRP
jgi:hypothetical protein